MTPETAMSPLAGVLVGVPLLTAAIVARGRGGSSKDGPPARVAMLPTAIVSTVSALALLLVGLSLARAIPPHLALVDPFGLTRLDAATLMPVLAIALLSLAQGVHTLGYLLSETTAIREDRTRTRRLLGLHHLVAAGAIGVAIADRPFLSMSALSLLVLGLHGLWYLSAGYLRRDRVAPFLDTAGVALALILLGAAGLAAAVSGAASPVPDAISLLPQVLALSSVGTGATAIVLLLAGFGLLGGFLPAASGASRAMCEVPNTLAVFVPGVLPLLSLIVLARWIAVPGTARALPGHLLCALGAASAALALVRLARAAAPRARFAAATTLHASVAAIGIGFGTVPSVHAALFHLLSLALIAPLGQIAPPRGTGIDRTPLVARHGLAALPPSPLFVSSCLLLSAVWRAEHRVLPVFLGLALLGCAWLLHRTPAADPDERPVAAVPEPRSGGAPDLAVRLSTLPVVLLAVLAAGLGLAWPVALHGGLAAAAAALLGATP